MIENTELIKTSLMTALKKTMEDMAFEEVEFLGCDMVTPVIPEENLWARLAILQPFAGEICIEVSAGYARLVTEALYGEVSEDVTDESVGDALAEILNTIAGVFMKEYTPHDKSFELGLPLIGKGAMTNVPQKILSLSFDVGGQVLTAFVAEGSPQMAGKNNVAMQGGF